MRAVRCYWKRGFADLAEAKVSGSTWVPIGATLVVIGACVSVSLTIQGQFASLRGDLNAMRTTMDSMNEASKETWTRSRQEAWALRLQLNNTGIIVPRLEGDGPIR